VEVNPLLADAREALETQEFDVALSDVDKLLGDSPGSAEGVELKKTILYRYGKSQLDAGRYVGSYRVLSDLAKLDPKYLDSAALREQVRGRLIQDLYQEGIRLYRDENLRGAIGKWRAVLEYDPTHAEARKNIEQAERLLRALQERQQEKQ
jgi:tetratricopeptide (TPR) repeat protein